MEGTPASHKTASCVLLGHEKTTKTSQGKAKEEEGVGKLAPSPFISLQDGESSFVPAHKNVFVVPQGTTNHSLRLNGVFCCWGVFFANCLGCSHRKQIQRQVEVDLSNSRQQETGFSYFYTHTHPHQCMLCWSFCAPV